MKRIYHTWDKWECYPAGFYEDHPPEGMTATDAEEKYKALLSDIPHFEAVLANVISKWTHSCEHYLSNSNMNRIAWLGQASLVYEFGIPACFRGGFNLLTESEQRLANNAALKYLNRWLIANGEEELNESSVQSQTVPNLY